MLAFETIPREQVNAFLEAELEVLIKKLLRERVNRKQCGDTSEWGEDDIEQQANCVITEDILRKMFDRVIRGTISKSFRDMASEMVNAANEDTHDIENEIDQLTAQNQTAQNEAHTSNYFSQPRQRRGSSGANNTNALENTPTTSSMHRSAPRIARRKTFSGTSTRLSQASFPSQAENTENHSRYHDGLGPNSESSVEEEELLEEHLEEQIHCLVLGCPRDTYISQICMNCGKSEEICKQL